MWNRKKKNYKTPQLTGDVIVTLLKNGVRNVYFTDVYETADKTEKNNRTKRLNENVSMI